LETSEGTKVKVMLYGIDAPEKRQPFGNEAFDALNSKILKHNKKWLDILSLPLK
jgi:endonuclease YncB( thermonuclease family)